MGAASGTTVLVAPRPNRFDRRRERTRADLLDAAARVISAKGYHDTRISDIAAEADVGLGTFYLHFQTKNEIFIELIERGVAQSRSRIAEAKSGATDAAGKLRITVTTVLDAAAQNREISRILFGHGQIFLALMAKVHRMHIEDLRDDLFALLGERAETVATLTIGMLSHAVAWLLERGPDALDEIKEVAVGYALGGLERNLAELGAERARNSS